MLFWKQLNIVDLNDIERSRTAAFTVVLIINICIPGLFFFRFAFKNKRNRIYGINLSLSYSISNNEKSGIKNMIGLLFE